MANTHADRHSPEQAPKASGLTFWRTPQGLAAIALIGAALYFLLTEHRAHVIAALPWLILLICPVLHLVMHRGHGHGQHRDHSGRNGHE